MTTAATAASSESEPANVSWVRDGITELVMYRELVASLVRRELLIRYKYAPLGIAWALLQPIAATAVFALLLGRVDGIPTDGLPYVPFVFAGVTIASSVAVISAVVAEYFGGLQNGLGSRIASAAAQSGYPRAWAYVVASIVLGLVFYAVTLLAERAASRWARIPIT